MFIHFSLGFLKDRTLLGPSQPCEDAGTCGWLNLRTKHSWAWLGGDCLAVEALDNCVTGLKSLPNMRAQAGGGCEPFGSINAGD